MSAQAARNGLEWFSRDALPLWLDRGLDRKRGGFYEALDQDSAQNTADFRRLRVVTRQTYVFSAALRLGLSGAREGLDHALAFLLGPARHPEGGFANRFDMDGKVIDPTRDLYDLAFTCFALAHAYDVTRDAALRDEAVALAGFIRRQMAHPEGGYQEALPPKTPRRQNPHMHFLEACLAWAELDPEGPFVALAGELAGLFRSRFYEPQTGTLPEFFDESLVALPGEGGIVTEPGHHFEWVWLLHHAQRLGLWSAGPEQEALYRFAHAHGIDPDTGMSFGEVSTTGQVLAVPTRLWAATEWTKAEAIMPDPQAPQKAAQAWAISERFLQTDIPGLWHERWNPAQGGFVPGPAPATSFYHIVMAIEVLADSAGLHPRPFAQDIAA